MTTFHNFVFRIQTGGAIMVLKPNGIGLIRCKQITIAWGKMSQSIKIRSWKKVSQNSI